MGCLDSSIEVIYNNPIEIKIANYKKDGLDVYEYINKNDTFKFLSHGTYFICPYCNQKFSETVMKELEKVKFYGYYSNVPKYLDAINSREINIFDTLESLAKIIEREKSFIENPFYKFKCIPNNKEYYIKLYMFPYDDLDKYLKDKRYHYNVWRKDESIKQTLIDIRRMRKYEGINLDRACVSKKITKDGYFNGKKLCGRVKVVESWADFKVEVVTGWSDLRVKKVDDSPTNIGEWQFVDSWPDFTIEYVSSYADFKIKFVDYSPGVC